MANVQKYTRGAVGHLFGHYERKKDDEGKYIKFGNQDIDTSRTKYNYNLCERECSQLDYLHKRLSEVHCSKRSDVNVLCSWVVTLPEDCSMQEYFFKSVYKFLAKKYGEDNVVSAWVHRDENRDHMHFTFIPVVYDQKKERYKVSAKELITKKHLASFHNELNDFVSNELGYEVGILNGATIEGNKTVKQLKKISELQATIDDLEDFLSLDDKIILKVYKDRLEGAEAFIKAHGLQEQYREHTRKYQGVKKSLNFTFDR